MSMTDLLEPRGIPTLFGEVFEKNVTFCIDTSGSMYRGIEIVKEHLIETLLKHASKGKPTMFNIIEFNSEVTQWADKMVTCTPQTVAVAKEWVNKLAAKTGTNTKDALLTAFNDPLCDAIYLVTDGLPDHNPVEILDHMANIGKLRPIHCIYLCSDDLTESASIEFLEDLAIESYGSFHIVTLSTHGCVERITPIYRADHAHERIIRTLNGTIHPQLKKCSVATTLQVDPDESLLLAPRVSRLHPPPYGYPACDPYYAHHLGMPHRYYYPQAWSRYRPARGWLKAQEQMMETIETAELSPAAGSLLINKRVLARHVGDGYFYLGTVKSQILSDKFLVAFGPTKHGKFKEVAYQDTWVYDIIDVDDARRHTILTGDKVLAPWEPEGERYGPGNVIEGHEKREAAGPDDKDLAVSFSNGKVEKVAHETAIWMPTEVYERLALELKMPREARETLISEESYPKATLEGYPTSGPVAYPGEYDLADPIYFEADPLVMDGRPWRHPYHPAYPIIFKRGEREGVSSAKSEVTSKDMDKLIPGTNLTQKELDDRIVSQLMEHKLLLDEKETEKGTNKEERDMDASLPRAAELELEKCLQRRRREWEMEQEVLQREIERERLLKKRDIQEENILRKSVSFKEDNAGDVKAEDLERSHADSGIGSKQSSARYRQDEIDEYFSDPEEMTKSRDFGVNTDSELLYRRQTKLVSRQRPRWKKYWRADPGMPVTKSVHSGPFRETMSQTPFEAKCQRYDPYITEWTSPAYKYVDPYAKHDYSNSVSQLLRTPQPPLENRPAPRPEHVRPMSADAKQDARLYFKQRKTLERDAAWKFRTHQEDQMSGLMQDQHRDRIQAQISHDKDRQIREQHMVEQSRQNKRFVSKELRQRVEVDKQREVDHEQMRIGAMQRRREHRDEITRQREQQTENTTKLREEVKQQRSQERWNDTQRRLDHEDAEATRKSQQFQAAKLNRIQHFQDLEEHGQRMKDVRIGVSDRHLTMFSSAVPM